MPPGTGEYLVFLHTLRHRKGQPYFDGIDLTPWAEHQPDEWYGWIAGGESTGGGGPFKVARPQFEICHLNTSGGSYWAIDGERIPDMSKSERCRALVETGRDVMFSPPRVIPLPAFVSRRNGLTPRRHAAVVRLADPSVASFADAFLSLEAMDATSLSKDPQTAAIVGDEFVRSCEALSAERWAEHRRATVPLGTLVPAEVGAAGAEVGCVVRLDSPADDAGGPAFHCTVFLADAVPLAPGMALRRRSGLWPPGRPPRLLEREVGTVLQAGPAEPLGALMPEPGADASATDLTLVCLSCQTHHPAAGFTSEQLEVAELTALWRSDWRELALLRRTRALYDRCPAARGFVKPAADAIMESDDPDVMDQVMNNVPFSEIRPPRPPDYERKVAEWLDSDPELRHFLETCSFDLEARTKGVEDAERLYRRKLRGRSVMCPACGGGLLALDGDRFRTST